MDWRGGTPPSRIRRIDRLDDREDRHPRRARRGIDQALERELDVLAREGVAIVEFYAVAQMEDERLRIRILHATARSGSTRLAVASHLSRQV